MRSVDLTVYQKVSVEIFTAYDWSWCAILKSCVSIHCVGFLVRYSISVLCRSSPNFVSAEDTLLDISHLTKPNRLSHVCFIS